MAGKVDKTALIQNLKSQDDGISKILNLKRFSLIDSNTREELSRIQTETKEIIRKLENNEFQIAVVGLEKAGKSSFCNALIESNMLPTKQGRCTYTATSIISSNESKADIVFFTKQEFEADLQDKLSKLGIENSDTFSLSNLDSSTYNSLYENISSEKKEKYGETLNEEIINIIEYKNKLIDYLDRPAISFTGENVNDSIYNYIVAPEIAMAVKEVIIKSPLLDKMPNAVIYDVPGFNSPTARHMQQTKERMYRADAIIMVATADKPSITSEQLKAFRDSDNDGTALADKLFIFENRSDEATLQENIPLIFYEWGEKYKILYDHNRFFFGSANARLQQINKLPVEEKKKNKDYVSPMMGSISILDDSLSDVKEKSSAEKGFGIVSLREALEEYNQNERIKVLQGRVGRLQSRLKEILAPLTLTSNSDEEPISVDGALFAKFMRDFNENLCKSLNDFRDESKQSFLKDKPLSEELSTYIKDHINSESYNALLSESLERAKKELNIISDNNGTLSVAEIEAKVRNDLFARMYEDDFANQMDKIVTEQHDDITNKILDIIMNSLGMQGSTKYYEPVKERIQCEFAKILDSENTEKYYRSLIERYSRDLYELLVGQRYAEERYERFLADISGYFSLAVYYDDSIDPKSAKDAKSVGTALANNDFCRQMLCHNYTSQKVNAAIDSVKERVRSIVRVEKLPESVLSLVVSIARCDIIGAGEAIVNALNGVASINDEPTRIENAKMALRQLGQNYNGNISVYNADLTDSDTFRKLYKASFESSRNYNDVISFVKEDIEILQDVMLHCFVRALNLEKPFIAREYLVIENVKKHVDSDGFIDFIGRTIPMIRPEEYDKIKDASLERQMNDECRKAVTDIMNSMNNN